MFEPELQPLYDRYNSVLKPLIAEYESRNEDFVTPLLLDLPDMFDHIALYRKTRESQHISQASAHLENAITQVRTCVVGSMMNSIDEFKSKLSPSLLEHLDNGHFYGPFNNLETQVRECKDTDLEKAYSLLKEMEEMMHGCHDGVLSSTLITDSRPTVIMKWIISIIIALILNIIAYKLL